VQPEQRVNIVIQVTIQVTSPTQNTILHWKSL